MRNIKDLKETSVWKLTGKFVYQAVPPENLIRVNQKNLVSGKGILKGGPNPLHQMVLRELGLMWIDEQADPASLLRKR
uniref:YTH domain containing 1 n=1 Tax=Molossus molossus TaxID=27622 RepID=A0A7J8K3T6_MOLMO|nr:YTH domain containing 1 [Molossus molossus]